MDTLEPGYTIFLNLLEVLYLGVGVIFSNSVITSLDPKDYQTRYERAGAFIAAIICVYIWPLFFIGPLLKRRK